MSPFPCFSPPFSFSVFPLSLPLLFLPFSLFLSLHLFCTRLETYFNFSFSFSPVCSQSLYMSAFFSPHFCVPSALHHIVFPITPPLPRLTASLAGQVLSVLFLTLPTLSPRSVPPLSSSNCFSPNHSVWSALTFVAGAPTFPLCFYFLFSSCYFAELFPVTLSLFKSFPDPLFLP